MASTTPIRAALYLRVSTDDQTTSNQRLELERVAASRGWTVVQVHEDAGISGAKGRDKRPGLDDALKGAVRGQYDVLMSWSVDRLGRSLEDLLAALNELHGAGRNLYLHTQGVDTTTPGGKALFQMMGVFAEFERAIIQERVKAGMARAKVTGTKSGIPIGRPRISAELERRVRELAAAGTGKGKIARTLGIGVSAVQRVLSAA